MTFTRKVAPRPSRPSKGGWAGGLLLRSAPIPAEKVARGFHEGLGQRCRRERGPPFFMAPATHTKSKHMSSIDASMLRKALGWTIGTECSKRDTVHDMLTKFRALNIEKLGSLPSSVSNVYDHFSRSSIPCRRFLLDDEKMSAFAMSESVSTRAWTPDRSYQREALQSVVSQDEKSIRSCILKICCGGGKTPVAVAIVSNSRMRTIVLTTGSVSCQQWKEHFVKFAHEGRGHLRDR